MPQHPTTWARNARFNLLFKLGGCCAECSITKELEFDCIIPQGHYHHAIGKVHRMVFYRKQHAEGNLQILCRGCNRKKVKSDLVYLRQKAENEPF